MFADVALRRSEHIPQAFCATGEWLYVSQANTTTGDAWVTRYSHLYGPYWRWDSEMLVRESHGWPLFANGDNGGQIGLIIKTGVDAFYWVLWQPGATVDYADGSKTSKVPIADGEPGGWARTTADGYDTFWKDGAKLFTRPSPGWVQGEIAVNDVLFTLRGGITYLGADEPINAADEIWFTSKTGQVFSIRSLPKSVGSDPETGEPIGGRKEHEGLAMVDGQLLIGTAVYRKPCYRYLITELEL